MRLPRPGDTVAGKFVLERLLGQGGMGAVFAARHLVLSKQVAIKIMLADPSNPEASTRFVNEGRAAANIQNEHVVRVDDVGDELGYAYMVLELLDGEDLSQLLERSPDHRLPPHVAVGYVLQALKGVMEAHAIGIVHRDLKPSNLFLAKRKDGSVVVKVLDFGISKAQGSSALAASPSALTSTKAMLGSPLYMSPEQLRSSKSVDHRADIWAIGVILYELMTGQLPFMGENLGELFAAILETEPLPLRQRVPGIPPQLDDIVMRCLARRADARFQTAAELSAALAPFATPTAAPSAAAVTNVVPSGPVPHAPAMSVTPVGGAAPAAPNEGPRAAGGTVAIGASTPSVFQHTNGGWQSTGSRPAIPKSKLPIFAAIGGVVLAAGIVLIVLALKGKPTQPDPSVGASAVATSVAPPPSPSPLPSPSPTPVVDPSPPTSVASATPAASTTTTTTSTGGHSTPKTPHGRVSAPPPTKPADTKPADTKPADTKPADTKPADTKPPKPPSTSQSPIQNAR